MIPKIIIQTYNSHRVTTPIKRAIESWKILNKDYKYMFFDDTECRQFIKENFNSDVTKAFDCLIPGAFKADLFRYCFLYIHGGVYSDVDNICMTPIDNFINEDDKLVLVKDRSIGNQGLIYNSFIATEENNPILKKAIDLVVYNVLNNLYPDSGIKRIDILSISGPRCLAIALNNTINRTIFRDFTLGKQEYEGIKFRILGIVENDREITHIKTEDETKVIKVKYQGYTPVNNYWKLFKDKGVYEKPYPLISCLCVSQNKIEIVGNAIDNFLNQTYINKELVIVTEKQNPNLLELRNLVGVKDNGKKQIRLIMVSARKYPTLGHLRNVSVDNAKGKYVLQWDDDDIHHKERISFMYDNLIETDKDSCFLRKVIIVDKNTNKKYLSRNWGGVEGTMIALKDSMPKYKHLKKGEDTPVRNYFINKDNYLIIDAPHIYTYNFHTNNTWEQTHLIKLCDVELEDK